MDTLQYEEQLDLLKKEISELRKELLRKDIEISILQNKVTEAYIQNVR